MVQYKKKKRRKKEKGASAESHLKSGVLDFSKSGIREK
jgi:hypothetical protein